MRRKFGVHRGKCGAPRRYDFDIDHIRRLTEQGWSTSQIAELYGCGAEQVRRVMVKHNIPRLPEGAQPGERNHQWQGGYTIDKRGYVLVHQPDHPAANSNGYIREHRLVMEEHLGRHLEPDEVVHHRNGDPADNRIENLELYESNAEHLKAELTGQVPDWSEEGQQRVQAALRKMHAIRRASGNGDGRSR